MDAGDVLFNRVGRDQLTEEECISIVASSFFNINASSLSSLNELMGTGRMEIIQDAELRTELVRLQQTRAGLVTMIAVQSGSLSIHPFAIFLSGPDSAGVVF